MSKLLFLGTGNAEGIPMAFCKCNRCTTSPSYEFRLRSSVYIDIQGLKILIDAGPDFRLQMLRHNIETIDIVLLSHLHYDHIGGLDELRAYNFFTKQDVEVFLSQDNYCTLQQVKPYLFTQNSLGESVKASFQFCPFEGDFGTLSVNSLKIKYVTYEQGMTKVNGFLFGKLAYITDLKTFSVKVKKELYNLDYLIISVSNYESVPYAKHLSIKEILDLVEEITPKRTLVTHIGHTLCVEDIQSKLPENVAFAFDGMEITF